MRDDRAAVRCPVVLLASEVDAVDERLLCRPLELHVDREPKREACPRLLRRHVCAHLLAHRVDTDLTEPVAAAQVGVVRGLDPCLAEPVAAAIPVAAQDLQLLG